MSDATPSLADRYREIRNRSVALCAPLAIEDYVPQPMDDVSPPKWHLAHTTWFWETMIAAPHYAGYREFDPQFGFLFNSYYENLGDRVPRAARGTLSRPTVAEVLEYRAHVDTAVMSLLDEPLTTPELAELIELGLQHEQQHQELLTTDLKYILGNNPLRPAYARTVTDSPAIDVSTEHAAQPSTPAWLDFPGGMIDIGATAPGFSFDNERPRHQVFVPAASLRTTLVSNREYLAFINDGGYREHRHWHSEGLDWIRANSLTAPLYWQQTGTGSYQHYTLMGLCDLVLDAPITHLSYFEAYAYAQWAGARLPTEFEWEALQSQLGWGARWEWTESAYLPYPGFRCAAGAVGEYNGKFMVNQHVLRGASFATPPGHARATYRNFFPASTRWQYTGVRLARCHPDAGGPT